MKIKIIYCTLLIFHLNAMEKEVLSFTLSEIKNINPSSKIQPQEKNSKYYNWKSTLYPEDTHNPTKTDVKTLIATCWENKSLTSAFDTSSDDYQSWKKNYYKPCPPKTSVEKTTVTVIMHSCVLIQLPNDINILTDCLFNNYNFEAGPIRHTLFKKVAPPSITLEELPTIHFTLESHNHEDHRDCKALKYIAQEHKAYPLIPKGNKSDYKKFGFEEKNIKEFTWWEQITVNVDEKSKVKITFLPARHCAGGLFDSRSSLWGSWMIESETNGQTEIIYFGGDTAYDEHLEKIKDKFGAINLALIPNTPYTMRELQTEMHTNREEAILAAIDLQAKKMITIHQGFKYCNDTLDGMTNIMLKIFETIKLGEIDKKTEPQQEIIQAINRLNYILNKLSKTKKPTKSAWKELAAKIKNMQLIIPQIGQAYPLEEKRNPEN